MNTMPWGCEDTARHMPGYALGSLPSAMADALLRHVLRCAACRSQHWAPYSAGLDASAMALSEALCEVIADEEQSGNLQGRSRSFEHSSSFGNATWSAREASLQMSTPQVRSLTLNHSSAAASTSAFRSSAPPSPSRFSLQRLGVFLPTVPMPEKVIGYRISLLADGDARAEPPPQALVLAQLTVTVVHNGVQFALEALMPGLSLDGESILPRPSPPRSLQRVGYHTLEGHGVAFALELGRSLLTDTVGWIELQPLRLPLTVSSHTIGRGSACFVQLLDGGTGRNTHFLPRVPMDREAFESTSLETLEVSREHARLTVEHDRLRLETLSRWPVWLLHRDSWRRVDRGALPLALSSGDRLAVGRQLFEIRADQYELQLTA